MSLSKGESGMLNKTVAFVLNDDASYDVIAASEKELNALKTKNKTKKSCTRIIAVGGGRGGGGGTVAVAAAAVEYAQSMHNVQSTSSYHQIYRTIYLHLLLFLLLLVSELNEVRAANNNIIAMAEKNAHITYDSYTASFKLGI